MENLDPNKLPKHIAIIMDGNGRWAQEQGQDRLFGHYEGVISVRKVVEAATEIDSALDCPTATTTMPKIKAVSIT